MKMEDIEKAIEFDEREVGDGVVQVRATLSLSSEAHFYDKQCNKDHGGKVQVQVRQEAMERLLRDIFEDRTRELQFAIAEVLRCGPFDIEELTSARGKLVRAALRMPRKKLEGPEF